MQRLFSKIFEAGPDAEQWDGRLVEPAARATPGARPGGAAGGRSVVPLVVGQGRARRVIGVGGKRVERKAVASGRALSPGVFDEGFSGRSTRSGLGDPPGDPH